MEEQKIKEIETRIYVTLKREFLTANQVIDACDVLSQNISKGMYDDRLKPLLELGILTFEKIIQAAHLLSRDMLLGKVEHELGESREHSYPLGVLFHVNPDNTEGIAVYSVIEGLLVGNINLVKLPSNDYGITAFLLKELMKINPLFREYIYLFSVRSGDKRMAKIASLADAIIVWGSDAAIKAVRAMAAPNQKVIEWGHKISFAYITSLGMSDENLWDLAVHIVQTKQMVCSACQGIYLECSEKKEIAAFGRKMNFFLEQEVKKNPEYDMIWTAGSTFSRYSYMLEHKGISFLAGNGINLLYSRKKELEPAITWGNIWVKQLNREEVIPILKRNHGYLQTVGLICGAEERPALSGIFIKAGVTNIRSAGDMSDVMWKDSHDGEYALRRYTKVIMGER